MKFLWMRFVKWMREWITLPARWRQYKQFLDMQDVWAEEHRRLASEMGYLGCHHLEAGVKIARRCMGAEEALRRLAASLEGEHDWKREYEREAAFSRAVGKQLSDAKEKLRALEDGMTASGLSPAEVERLALLAMAAGKLAAEAAKVVLYGWDSPSPCTGRPAYVDIERGIGRLQAAAELMDEAGDVRGGDVRAYGARAKERICEQVTRQ
jgi:hypothetical protein